MDEREMNSEKNLRIDLKDRIEELLEKRDYSGLKDILVVMNAADISTLFDDLKDSRIPLLFRLLPKVLAAEVCRK